MLGCRPAKEESRFDLCNTKKNTAGLYTNTHGFHNHYDSRSKENTDAGYYTCNSMVDISIRSSFSVGEVSLRPARRRTCARIRRSPTGNRGTVCDKKLDEDCKILFLCSGRTPLLSVAATVVPACTAVLSDWLSSKDDRTASQLAERFRVDTPQRVAEEDHISFLTVSIRGVPTFTAGPRKGPLGSTYYIIPKGPFRVLLTKRRGFHVILVRVHHASSSCFMHSGDTRTNFVCVWVWAERVVR